ncbi:MAG: response regulator transcription factor [Thermoanaerobaculia bacterium]|nr:response regulator transcription factor [Thermoanaerobaculia bacterium]
MFRRILVVDDDPDIVTTVALTLELEGFEVTTAGSAEEAERRIEQHGLPHLALVDIMMPGTDGLEFCRKVQSYCDLPVILLTAVDDDETKVRSIEEVAEDYVTKPFHPPELVARLKRVLRRLGNFEFRLEPETRIDENLAVDFAGKRAKVGEKDVSLTPTETKILYILVANARRTVRTDFLLGRLWPHDEVFEDTLRVHVHRLRQKIEPNVSSPRYLVTHRGEGYVFLPEQAS